MGYTPYDPLEDENSMVFKQNEVVKETRGHYIGPMPVQNFLDDFLPWNKETPEEYRTAEVPATRIDTLKSVPVASEPKAHQTFVDAFSGWPSEAARIAGGEQSYIKCPLSFKDAHRHRDASCGSMGTGVALYGQAHLRQTQSNVMDFSRVESFVEIRPGECYDAFIDGPAQVAAARASLEKGGQVSEESSPSKEEEEEDMSSELPEALLPISACSYPFENASRVGSKTRGELAAYNAVILTVQYRSHVFSALVCGTYARLMRWDRSCAIVCARFDYIEQPQILFRFYQRLAQLTDQQRGLDQTFTAPTKEEGVLAREALAPYASELWYGESESVHKEQKDINDLPLLKMTFDGESYVVPAPAYSERFLNPFGRSTRRCIIVRLQDKVVLYFKDYWRTDSALTLKESEIYKRLALHEVENVAELAAGGDVDGMETIGHHYASADWANRTAAPSRIRPLYAHRIILATLGRDLLTFPTAKSLVKCVADAMKAHQMAYEKARILHRDISAGNILMRLRPTDDSPVAGFLIDWDHSVVLDLIPPGDAHERHISRTGTWQFMSANLVENPYAEHTVLDDRESALFVLAYAALLHLDHDLSKIKLDDLLEIFNVYFYQEGRPDYGGSRKRGALLIGAFAEVNFRIPEMCELFKELCTTFAIRYTDPPTSRPAMVKRRRVHSAEEEEEELERRLNEVKAALYKEGMAQLHDGSWLYTTLSEAVDWMPERGSNEIDWIDHTTEKKVTLKPNEHSLKRPLNSADFNPAAARAIKRMKAFDGQAVIQ